ncbi:uncharacterized protein [Fopius arisanus]|uniref:DUF4789 domain-containing protein n=1 Tax=Fopius arisanus TaxID=64838 RepID=A0A9R1TPR0_9HYME|nr:PREDICTED: uncharacterized protein LOC105273796 [Fopius arisanus]
MTRILLTLLAICYCATVITMGNGQHVVFPFGGSSKNQSGKISILTAGIPIRIPGQCPPHMDRFPHPRNASSWFCDCVKGRLYYSLNDSCYEPYRRGPCKSSEYLILPQDQVASRCVLNPCREDNLVPFEGGCHPLHEKEGPCQENNILGVNSTTFHIECIPLDLVPFNIIDPGEDDGCPRGSRRTAYGICIPPLE